MNHKVAERELKHGLEIWPLPGIPNSLDAFAHDDRLSAAKSLRYGKTAHHVHSSTVSVIHGFTSQ